MERIFGISGTRTAMGRLFYRLLVLACVIVLGAMVGIVGSIGSLHIRLLEFTLLFLSVMMALHIYFKRHHALVPYSLLMWVMSPEMRRLLDWSFQSYTNTSIISLIPYCISLIMLIPIIKNIKQLERRIGLLLKIMGVALIYGFGVGFLKYGFSSVFDLLNYVVPFLVLAYVNVCRFDQDVRDKWLRSLGYLAVIVAAYGIYQYLALPPWDKFWMISSEMKSIGLPEPQKFRVFSLLNSPGPAGVFLSLALAVMTVQKRWRAFGVVGILIVAFALLLTLVRVGWIAYAVMIVAYFIRSHLKSKMKLLMLGIVIVLAYQIVLPVLPGSSQVTSRIDTFGSLEDDHSFNERLQFSTHIFSAVMANPVGMGLGSSGLGAKLTQNSDTLVAFDNGYLNIFYTFGLPLGLAVVILLVYLFVYLYKSSRTEKVYSPLSFAAISAVLFLLMASNILSGFSGYILLLIISLAYVPTSSNREGI
ncbi:O-antigen ligase family protein [Paenibacillus sp. ISL-20]|uniref:O-antigen ligase family protein n=1 Tax=Paenibacillus sp. ISL-20 TaxID=2819163 RepID=UPI001BEA42B8|nr:O-antigen ligase family protein [Paenibacillus sp. ISL-20]MBT2764473.1 O-antigen ligase family protein [Paenibacillus sp. ISL-20]